MSPLAAILVIWCAAAAVFCLGYFIGRNSR